MRQYSQNRRQQIVGNYVPKDVDMKLHVMNFKNTLMDILYVYSSVI